MGHMRVIQHTLFSILQRSWQYLLAVPCTCLFLCFFQPNRFEMEYERQRFLKRIALLLRLGLLLFFLTYPFTMAFQLLFNGCPLSCSAAGINSLLFTAQAVALGVGCGIVAGMLGDIGLGIIFAIALGMTGIVVGNAGASFARGLAVAVVLGLVGGTGRGQKWGISGGIAGSLVGGFGWAFASFLARGTPDGITGGVLVAIVF